jgi:hypothetical protein
MKTKLGDVFEIKLEDGALAYAQALKEPEFAFFELSPVENSTVNPLFRIWVHKSAVNEWRKIGNAVPSTELETEIPRFKQDPINGKLSIYKGGSEQSATHEEVQGLECAAVWEGAHINDRLSDYLFGRKNKWVESLRPKVNG